MQVEWKTAVQRFLLNNLGQLDQEDMDVWLDGDLKLYELLEPFLKTMAPYRSEVLRELHQTSQAEIMDKFVAEHPELTIRDKALATVRIGKEIEGIKAILVSA